MKEPCFPQQMPPHHPRLSGYEECSPISCNTHVHKQQTDTQTWRLTVMIHNQFTEAQLIRRNLTDAFRGGGGIWGLGFLVAKTAQNKEKCSRSWRAATTGFTPRSTKREQKQVNKQGWNKQQHVLCSDINRIQGEQSTTLFHLFNCHHLRPVLDFIVFIINRDIPGG